jgi:hypothetical protein
MPVVREGYAAALRDAGLLPEPNDNAAVLPGSVVYDLVRSLGYEPSRVCEIVADATEGLIVSGYRRADGSIQMSEDNGPVRWTNTHRIDWSSTS